MTLIQEILTSMASLEVNPKLILTHFTAFALGAITTIALVLIAAAVFILWLPYYIAPLKPKRPFVPQPQSIPSNASDLTASEYDQVDPYLTKSGWIKIASVPLTEVELFNHDFSFDNGAQDTKSKHTSLFKRLKRKIPLVDLKKNLSHCFG